MKPSTIILHHSLTKDGQTVNSQAIRKWHIEHDGMRDIGYHFIIEEIKGRHEILLGRLPNENGAHCKQQGMNRKSVGICFIGNFDEEPPPGDMWVLGLRLVESLCETMSIDIEQVFGHREFAAYKSCPGKAFGLDAFRSQLFE